MESPDLSQESNENKFGCRRRFFDSLLKNFEVKQTYFVVVLCICRCMKMGKEREKRKEMGIITKENDPTCSEQYFLVISTD